jgi:hypothetical protein
MAGDVMAVGKTLTVYLAADLKKFNTGMAQAQGGLKGFSNSLKNMLGPAMIGAGLALGALATKMAVDGVKAAMDDEAAVRKLATTMENLGLAHDTKKVEAYIYQLERSLGVADTELRPAYDRLVRALGDTEKAQDALSLSLDVSTGSGKSLEAVTDALGKAYEGNIAGLSRLGAGIDAATIRTGDMDEITRVLSDTFAGQAAASADTLEGRIRVLKTGTDNLAEAFGKGLLTGVKEATEGTGDLVKSMEKLEPALEDAGEAVADLVALVAKLYDGFTFLSDLEETLTTKTGLLGDAYGFLTDTLNPLAGVFDALDMVMGNTTDSAYRASPAMESLGNAAAYAVGPLVDMAVVTNSLADSAYDSGIAALKQADYIARLTKILGHAPGVITTTTTETTTLTTATRNYGTTVEEVSKKQQKLIDLNAKVADSYSTTADKLNTRMEKLNENLGILGSMQDKLTAGLDLAAAFEGQFDEAGEATGVSLLEGFNKQIDQANYFGQVLNAIKAQGADQSLIDQIASLGPVTGAALAQQMIDDGLVTTLNDKWMTVQETTKGLAMGLVPEFVSAGIESGAAAIDGLATQLAKEGARLTKLGKRMAKPVGSAFKSQLAKDIAEAIANVEAAGSAARASAIAKAEAREAVVTQQQVALAIGNIIRQSDARNGAPIPAVLS